MILTSARVPAVAISRSPWGAWSTASALAACIIFAASSIGLASKPRNHVIAGVAPGRSIAGEKVRVYCPTFEPGKKVRVLLDRDPANDAPPLEFAVVAGKAHAVDLTLPADLEPGLYRVAALDRRGRGRPQWLPALEVVPSEIAPAPPTKEPGITARAQPIVPGQTAVGEWSGPGDTHYYLLTAGAGTAFDLFLERTDTSLSIFHPKSVDPELYIAGPDGLVTRRNGYASDISADDSNARIDAYVAVMSGAHLICCRTSRGSGSYRLHLRRIGAAPGDAFTTVAYGALAITVVGAGPDDTYTLERLVFDPRGLPVGGARLLWSVTGSEVVAGSEQPSRPDGVASVDVRLGKEVSLTATAHFRWPWVDPEVAATEPFRPGGGGNVILHIRFDPDGTVFSERRLNGRL